MRKVFSMLLAGLLLVSLNFTSSFATSLQKNDKSLSNASAHLDNPHGKRTSENPVKPQSSRPDENPAKSNSNRPSENPGKGIATAPGKNGKAGASLLPHGQKCVAHSTSTDKNINGVENGNGASANCAPAYALGDTGPGGGVIFYYSAAGFNCGVDLLSTCRYLEVAPPTWSGANDPALPWSQNFRFADVENLTNLASPNNSVIGLGLSNTALILLQHGTYNAISNNYAAGAANAYQGGGLRDWYLADSAELNQLCKYTNMQPWVSNESLCAANSNTRSRLLGLLDGQSLRPEVTAYYWSSSENIFDPLDNYSHGAFTQYFTGLSQPAAFKGQLGWVRPIRAF